jgi:hypothetical protein
MPNVGSWNGKWTGESNFYARTRSFRGAENLLKAAEILKIRYFHYNFGDGWSAGVTVKQINSAEAAKVNKKTRGFYGYDWMIDSIIEKLCIESTIRP